MNPMQRAPVLVRGFSGKRGSPPDWILAILLILAPAPAAAADASGDFLLFPAVEWRDDHGADPRGYATDDQWFASLDLFATADVGNFRFLGEWFLTEDAQEIQRLQLGWRFGPEDTVWLGRFHTPIGYWNTAYHHGTYLQTSISRPGIADFEGSHGPLPTHFTGLLWEGAADAGDGSLHYSLGLGAGPVLNGKLDPFDVANPDDHDHDHETGVILNVSWRPTYHGRNQVGAFAGRTRITDSAAIFDRTEQTLYGFFGNWHWDQLRLVGAWFHVSNAFAGIPAPDEDFSAAYLQGEYGIGARTTAYARYETTDDARAEYLYLGRFDNFITERALGGLRFELTDRQALTVELAARESFDKAADRITVQWSAYFP
jgi:hypothetical protein